MIYFKHDQPPELTGSLHIILCKYSDIGWNIYRNKFFLSEKEAIEEAVGLIHEFLPEEIKIREIELGTNKNLISPF